MEFLKPTFPDLYVVLSEPRCDERGFFARMFCAQEFGRHGIIFDVVQSNTSGKHPPAEPGHKAGKAGGTDVAPSPNRRALLNRASLPS